jgi:hypothetical protein
MAYEVQLVSKPMEEELSEQLLDLQNALMEAVWNSERVAKALAQLKESGREIQIAIDAMLVDGKTVDGKPQPEGPAPSQTDSTNATLFGPTDRMFLHTLKISDE